MHFCSEASQLKAHKNKIGAEHYYEEHWKVLIDACYSGGKYSGCSTYLLAQKTEEWVVCSISETLG